MPEIQPPSVFVPPFLAAMNRPALLSAFALAAALLAPAPAHAAGLAATPSAETPSGQPAGQAAPLRVIAAHPVVLGLARQIVKGTPIELVQAASARLPASRQPAYLAGGKGLDELLAAAHQAQAVLTLRSVWPDDQLYPLARRANIHIVEIDAANPIEGELPGIALTESTLREAKGSATVLINQPWQDSANLARMAMIMADSLSRLAPPQRERLQANFAAISQRLQQAQSEASRQLAQADELPVLLLTPRVQALATALQLEPVPWQAPEKDEDLPAALQKAIQAHRPRAILSHTAPDEAAAQAIAAAGVPLIVLRDNAPDPVQALTDAMLAVAQAMARKP